VGEAVLLFGLAIVCLVAFVITAALRIEPAGKSLDEISGHTTT
jgi:hypothetical protein